MLLLTACKKDELTLPAKVFLDFELISYEDENTLKSGPPVDLPFGSITINKGTLAIGSIEFEGRRDEGRDVFFVSDLQQNLIVDLETGKGKQELSFDIPQGVYNRMEFILELGEDDGISLVLEGVLRRGQAYELPIRFEYNIRDRIKIRAESGGETNKIVLRKDTPSRARIVVDAEEVFQFVKLPALQNATIYFHGGEDVLIISPDKNINIFNSMAIRIEKSFRVIID